MSRRVSLTWKGLDRPGLTEAQRAEFFASLAAIGAHMGMQPVAVRALLAQVQADMDRRRARRKGGAGARSGDRAIPESEARP